MSVWRTNEATNVSVRNLRYVFSRFSVISQDRIFTGNVSTFSSVNILMVESNMNELGLISKTKPTKQY